MSEPTTTTPANTTTTPAAAESAAPKVQVANHASAASDSGPRFFDSVEAAMSAAPPSSTAEAVPAIAEPPAAKEKLTKVDIAADESDADEGFGGGDKENSADDDAEGEDASADEVFLTIKTDGEERNLTKEETKVMAQKGLVADERFKEAAAMRKQAEDIVRRLKEDPKSILTHPAIAADFRKVAEDFLFDVYDYESKTDEERKTIDERKELADLRKERDKTREADEKRKLEGATQFYVQKFQKQLESEVAASGIPDAMWAQQRAVHYMKQNWAKGIKPSAADVMDLVKEDYSNFRSRSVENMTPEQTLAFLGEEKFKQLRAYQREQRKKAAADVPPSVKPSTSGNMKGRDTKRSSGYISSTRDIFG